MKIIIKQGIIRYFLKIDSLLTKIIIFKNTKISKWVKCAARARKEIKTESLWSNSKIKLRSLRPRGLRKSKMRRPLHPVKTKPLTLLSKVTSMNQISCNSSIPTPCSKLAKRSSRLRKGTSNSISS